MDLEKGIAFKFNNDEYLFVLNSDITDLDHYDSSSVLIGKKMLTRVTYKRNGNLKQIIIEDKDKIFFNKISDTLSNDYRLIELPDVEG
jgi:hypothetical protein